MFLRNVGLSPNFMALQSRRPYSSVYLTVFFLSFFLSLFLSYILSCLLSYLVLSIPQTESMYIVLNSITGDEYDVYVTHIDINNKIRRKF